MEVILLTGASGFIGSHTLLALIEAGYEVIAMQNSKSSAIERVQALTDRQITTCRCNLLNYDDLSRVFDEHSITTVIHLAASKGINESIKSPIECYKNNLTGLLNLLEVRLHFSALPLVHPLVSKVLRNIFIQNQVMKSHNVKNLIFSSSCAIYGNQNALPVPESAIPQPLLNVYARSKFYAEEMLKDVARSDPKLKITVLRYFNPIGAHPSGKLGEDPERSQINFLTLISQIATGKRANLVIYGNDFDTNDGTCNRDYVHIADVAEAHVAVMRNLKHEGGIRFYNIGSGVGTSLVQLIKIFENVNNVKIRYEVKGRRENEIGEIVANVSMAAHDFDWRASRGIEEMCSDCWKWTKFSLNGDVSE